jgi:hypothetical protein
MFTRVYTSLYGLDVLGYAGDSLKIQPQEEEGEDEEEDKICVLIMQ